MYASLPERLRLVLSDNGQTAFFTKSLFFYASLFLLLFLNITIHLISLLYAFMPSWLMLIPQKKYWTETFSQRKELARVLKMWTKGMLLLINVFLLAFLVRIYSINAEEIKIDTTWLLYVLPLLMIGWKIWLFRLLSYKDPLNSF
ncbi:MAG: hypothetical protein RMJ89_02885 [Flammeovirgaceae bacterium]|nr:hypothetical protein [Flammeovirgaceae bacterium]